MEDYIWVEKYRPQSVSDCILDDEVESRIKTLLNDREINHLFFYGTPGVGKTTLAKAICKDLKIDCLVINASMESNIDTLRNEIVHFAGSVSIENPDMKKAIILDEVDGVVSVNFMNALRAVIEEFVENCVFIMTCNYPEKVPGAIRSRLHSYDFSITNKKTYSSKLKKRIKEILETEKVEYDPKIILSIIKHNFPDIRKMIHFLQQNKDYLCDENIIYRLEGSDVSNLLNALKDRDYGEINEVLVKDFVLTDGIFRKLFDSLEDFIEEESLAQAIYLINQYQYKHVFVPDKEINIRTLFIELMGNCKFK